MAWKNILPKRMPGHRHWSRGNESSNGPGVTSNGSVNTVPATRKDRLISVPPRRQAEAIIKLLSYYYTQVLRLNEEVK